MKEFYNMVSLLLNPEEDFSSWAKARKIIINGLVENDRRVIREFIYSFNSKNKHFLSPFGDILHEAYIESKVRKETKHIADIARRLINKGYIDFIEKTVCSMILNSDEYMIDAIKVIYCEKERTLGVYDSFPKTGTSDHIFLTLIVFLHNFHDKNPPKRIKSNSGMISEKYLMDLTSRIILNDTIDDLWEILNEIKDRDNLKDFRSVIIDKIVDIAKKREELLMIIEKSEIINCSELREKAGKKLSKIDQ